MSETSTLDELRQRIDKLDGELLSLLNQRARLAMQIADAKNGGSDGDCFYRPEREAQVLRKVLATHSGGPLPEKETAHLFREIMSACRSLQQTMNIAYLGPQGTFTQAAALKHFGHAVDTTAMGSITQVFQEVESGAHKYGVVPVENSIEGVVNHTLDLLINSSLMICGEVELRIYQHLLSRAAAVDKIKRIYSHQQSFAQCAVWLDSHLAEVERVAVGSNGEAARIAAGDDQAAAIAGEAAAQVYGLTTLVRNIESEANNTTRFLVLGQQQIAPSGDDKTSFLFTVPHKPGALQAILSCFSDNGINLTRIESRPSRKGMWEYIFFVDIEGHVEDSIVALALDRLENHSPMVKLLGSYPRAVL